MSSEIRKGWIDLGDQQLETRSWGPASTAAPMLLLLHEGLGSADLWGEVPRCLAAATGCSVLAYSRAGLGRSSPKPLPWPSSFMHDEALDVLPRLLDKVGFRRGLLIGASDGASIAAIYAGSVRDDRIAGISLTAPHFIVEEATAAGARAARQAFERGDLRQRLARWHDHVDIAFHGWNDAFADAEFKRGWSITDLLPGIAVPVQILQGELDEYGTPEQLEIARRLCRCPLQARLLPGLGHSIHREAAELTCNIIAEFVRQVLR